MGIYSLKSQYKYAASLPPPPVTDSLVLYLDANNTESYPGSGTTWTDLSGNGNNGALRNWASTSLSVVSGVSCLYLNGSSAGNGDILISNFYRDFVAGDNTHTFEWWGYANSYSIDPFNSGACGTPCIAYGESGYYFDTTGGNGVDAGVVLSKWHQYILVVNGSTATSFKDGVQIDSRNDWGTPASADRSGVIGSRGWANRTNDFYLSTYRWYNRPLSETEILQNFEADRDRHFI